MLKTQSGVCFFMRMQGDRSCMSFFLVKHALKGYKRKHFVADKRLAISVDLLGHLCDVSKDVCFSLHESLLFTLAICLCFFGAFRVSELLLYKVSDDTGLLFQDVFARTDSIQVLLHKSKTEPVRMCGLRRWPPNP